VFQAEEVTFLQKKGQTIESPIITVEDRLLIGKKPSAMKMLVMR
jgi:arsenate reductase-like glutaredoxin family protein